MIKRAQANCESPSAYSAEIISRAFARLFVLGIYTSFQRKGEFS